MSLLMVTLVTFGYRAMMNIIDVAAVAETDFLSGRELGKAHLPKFIASALNVPEDETVLWDWSGIDNATASYIAAAFVPLLRMVSAGKLKRYFVFYRLNPHCLEELAYVLEAEKLSVLVTKDKKAMNLEIVGYLDPVHRQTLDTVFRRGSISAKDLQDKFGTTPIKRTAWIKRLTTLYEMGLLKRRKDGREYIYEGVIR
jgi:hypothetical protein